MHIILVMCEHARAHGMHIRRVMRKRERDVYAWCVYSQKVLC
jgi:hypothetical protein